MTLRADLFDWLSAQDLWQQTLARRLTERTELEEDEYLEAVLLVKAAFGALPDGQDEPAAEQLRPEDLPTEPAGPAPKLVTFGCLQGVGAITNRHELSFSEGLTVVYGANAAGKSTYVRAMKRVCRTVDRDAEVRGNVFSDPAGGSDPTARVGWSLKDEAEAEEIELKDPPDLGLQTISVFDAPCAEIYIDSQNGISYVPPGLLLLARLAALQDRMRADLQLEISSLRSRAFSFPEFDAESAVRTFLEGLSGTSDIDEAEMLATLEESETARLVELQATLASSAAHSVQADALAAQEDAEQARELIARVRETRSRTDAEGIRQFQEVALKKTQAEKTVELAAQAFSDLPLSGFGSDAWRRMWQAAREFTASNSTDFPPSVGEPCPLCMQDLSDEAAHRFETFEQHVASAVQREAENARVDFQTAVLGLGERDIQEISESEFLRRLATIDEPIATRVQTFLDEVLSRIQAVRSGPELEPLPQITSDPTEVLGNWAKGREEHSSILLSAKDPERESQLRQEWIELDARRRLSTRLDEVRARIEELRLMAALETARTGLATNRITTKQKEFTEGALAGELEEQLKVELESLNCGHLPVALNPETSVGETRVGLRLAGAYGAPRVSDIASEGEQRALALSFFFAEVASGAGDGGIVVDDPVSSLDEERRSYIAERLTQEAACRQVIVFTHDLPFMLELVERAEASEIGSYTMQGVWRLGSEVGRVDDQPPFKAMNFKRRVASLTEAVQEWNSQSDPASFDEAWRRVCAFYARMRTTWERAVEERLFRGVVGRFQRQVKTLSLRDVSVSEDQVKTIESAMARCSEFVHDEPPSASSPMPTRSDLAADLEVLRTFEQETRT